MSETSDLLIRSARLRHRPGALYDIVVQGGRIQAIEESSGLSAATVLDAAGGLVTEPFVNPHLHLDKVYTLQRLEEESSLRAYHGEGMGNAMSAIEAASRVKEAYSQDWIVENARRALRAAVVHGNTHIRAFADVDSKARLEGVKALLQVKEEFRGVVELQVVAFPQDGVLREPGAAELVGEAVAMGADVVGGIPWIEYTDAAAGEHVRRMFEIAVANDKPVSMLVDDAGDPGLRTLEMMAVHAIESGWQGRVLAHHARAMALYPEPYFQKLAALLRQAGMPVVTDPHTGPLHARVRDLLDAGVGVCLGQDDISDAYYPFGRNSMLEVAFLASHMLWMTTGEDMDRLYDMITVDAARAMGLEGFGLEAGAPADMVVLEAPSVLEALREHRAPVSVIRDGKVVDVGTVDARE
ncbi:MAG: amidohydrolase family protein [Deltaproteobacteria bacterium]|nr:amidohydrolase family protein [Deltaproteobacteria bacterium]